MSIEERNTRVMLEIFRAIEHRHPDPRHRDDEVLRTLFQPDVEFHWPSFLPYGGVSRGFGHTGATWADTWNALQPTENERRMDPRVVATNDQEVVILWRQRGVSPGGARLDSEVLALYQLRDGKLARAQMFYFDPTAVMRFLEGTKSSVTR
jgi:ketosteroid isomerase-like protein